MPAATAAPEAATAARTCLDAILAGQALPGAALARLVSLCCAPDPGIAAASSKILFADLVEPLSDPFDPRLSAAYVWLFARVIDQARTKPGFEKVDARLRRFGILDEESLVRRTDELRTRGFRSAVSGEPRRVAVLSRVTIGADVAVSSVALNYAMRRFPEAETAFFSGPKPARLYSGDPRIRLISSDYPRGGSLLDRLSAWTHLTGAIENWQGQRHGALVIDPDSRLTQLGLLPLTAGDDGYCFFDSRSYLPESREPIAALASGWLGETLGAAVPPAQPFAAPPEEDLAEGRRLRASAGDLRLAAINWGVGGNGTKRVPGGFEQAATLELLRRGWQVVLDRGAGPAESALADEIEAAADGAGHAGRLRVFAGPISGFAGVIAAANLYLGYDSAGGHLAAALGVPAVTIFAGAASQRFQDRWRPWGARPAAVIPAGPADGPESVLARLRELLD